MGQIYKTRQTIKEQGRVRHNEKEGDIMGIEKANTRKNKTRRSGGQTRKNGTKRDKARESGTNQQRVRQREKEPKTEQERARQNRERTN